MKKLILVLALVAAGCTNEPGAARALDGAGYTQVEFTGYRVFGCADSDDFSVGFRARGPSGKPVSGIVCSGFMKGATIRLD